ncbi:MAG TPA: citrate synthase, partial [Polyangiaceae bacterium]|nr:citrate synthase [Polyangiaceae bacterium]
MIKLDSTIQVMAQASSTKRSAEWLTATQAAELLGVKRETLYAYASRGWLKRHGAGRESRYALGDVERLKARHDARAGHTAVAAAALRFGQPVLDSAITGIDERGPRYRGHVAVDLARARVSFERTAELLWTGELPNASTWSLEQTRSPDVAVSTAPGASHLAWAAALVPALAIGDKARFGARREAELERARQLIFALARLGARNLRAKRPSSIA